MANRTRGTKRPNAKLTEDKVTRCRALYREGWTVAAIAKLYEVSRFSAHAAIVGDTWAHVPGAVPKGFRPNYWRQKASKGR